MKKYVLGIDAELLSVPRPVYTLLWWKLLISAGLSLRPSDFWQLRRIFDELFIRNRTGKAETVKHISGFLGRFS